MRREYFLAASLDDVGRVSTVLHQQLAVNDRDFHVLSLDDAGLEHHHLHAASAIQRTDLVRCAELGALGGIVVGLSLFSIAAFGMAIMDIPFSTRLFTATAVTGFPVLLGVMLGTLIGVMKENYKITRFHDELETGQHLLIVDAKQDKMDSIRQALALYPVIDAGEDSSLIFPFDEDSALVPLQAAA